MADYTDSQYLEVEKHFVSIFNNPEKITNLRIEMLIQEAYRIFVNKLMNYRVKRCNIRRVSTDFFHSGFLEAVSNTYGRTDRHAIARVNSTNVYLLDLETEHYIDTPDKVSLICSFIIVLDDGTEKVFELLPQVPFIASQIDLLKVRQMYYEEIKILSLQSSQELHDVIDSLVLNQNKKDE